jgi:hypothetical protein
MLIACGGKAAAALGHRLSKSFGTGSGDNRFKRLQQFLADGPELLIVLDNHENDGAIQRLFEALAGTRATFVITARRCLLSGVFIYPVTAPLVISGSAAFPRVAALTRLLRKSLAAFLEGVGVTQSLSEAGG